MKRKRTLINKQDSGTYLTVKRNPRTVVVFMSTIMSTKNLILKLLWKQSDLSFTKKHNHLSRVFCSLPEHMFFGSLWDSRSRLSWCFNWPSCDTIMGLVKISLGIRLPKLSSQETELEHNWKLKQESKWNTWPKPEGPKTSLEPRNATGLRLNVASTDTLVVKWQHDMYRAFCG